MLTCNLFPIFPIQHGIRIYNNIFVCTYQIYNTFINPSCCVKRFSFSNNTVVSSQVAKYCIIVYLLHNFVLYVYELHIYTIDKNGNSGEINMISFPYKAFFNVH